MWPSELRHSEVHAENAEEDAENAEKTIFGSVAFSFCLASRTDSALRFSEPVRGAFMSRLEAVMTYT